MATLINTSTIAEYGTLPLGIKDWVYNGLDCCVTLEIMEVLTAELVTDPAARANYNFKRSLLAPVMEMSLTGMRVDTHQRAKTLQEVENAKATISSNLTRIIHEGIGLENFNWRSPSQLQFLLYEVLGLKPIRKRNSKGGFSSTVNRAALEKLSIHYFAEPICSHILTLRDLDKRRQFLETALDADGRMRCSYNLAGTKTDRLSSFMSDFGTGTNLQNVDRNLRSIFIADEGMKFCNIDLEQADARNVGALCWQLFVEERGEAFAGAYLDACESGDLHTTVSRMAWPSLPWSGDPREDRKIADQIFYRSLTYRDTAKRLGHGTNYEGTAPTMSEHTKVLVSIIKEFQTNYFAGFPCIPAWHEWTRQQLKRSHSLTTLFGDRRFFWGRAIDPNTIRAAVAHTPQAMTGKQINRALLSLWREAKERGVTFHGQVHDSLLFQFPEKDEEEIIKWALARVPQKLILKKDREFFVPCEAKTGWNWGDFDPSNPSKNPGGLAKWRGHDSRKRPTTHKKHYSLLSDIWQEN